MFPKNNGTPEFKKKPKNWLKHKDTTPPNEAQFI